MKKVTLRPTFARRFPDPINSQENGHFHIDHHVLLCGVKHIPSDIPLDPNPRDQNIDKSIYKDVKESLLDGSDLTFHLKNKGITLIAESVVFDEKKQSAEVFFKDGDGIVDGGHTYKIIDKNRDEVPDGQFVKIEVLTGIPDYLIEPLAQGLNTSVQVSQMSLDNLGDKFQWIKDELKGAPYAEEISYKENQDGNFSVRDIIALLTLFNIDLFSESNSQPKIAYTSKAECLKRFKTNEKSYEKLCPLLKDILELHNYVQLRAPGLYNKEYGGKGRSLAFFHNRKRGTFYYIFVRKEATHKIVDGALYPLLGAFRSLIEDQGGSFAWKVGSFERVKQLFDEIGGALIKTIKTTSDSLARNPNAIGKNDPLWESLYNIVELEYFKNWKQGGRKLLR